MAKNTKRADARRRIRAATARDRRSRPGSRDHRPSWRAHLPRVRRCADAIVPGVSGTDRRLEPDESQAPAIEAGRRAAAARASEAARLAARNRFATCTSRLPLRRVVAADYVRS